MHIINDDLKYTFIFIIYEEDETLRFQGVFFSSLTEDL